MEHKVNITLEDTDNKELFTKESFSLAFIPKIGDTFDFIMDDNSLYQQIIHETKTKGRMRVADVNHVYFEKDKTHHVNIILAFSNDKRFK